MAQNPIAALDEAISGLESELTAEPRYVLLQSLKIARAAFGGAPARVGAPAKVEAEESDRKGRQMSPARVRALELAEEYVGNQLDLVKTKDIYDYIEEQGHSLPGGANNLASLLGRFPDKFESHGRQGWMKKMPPAPDAPDEMPEEGEEEPETTDVNFREGPSVASMSSLPDQQGTGADNA